MLRSATTSYYELDGLDSVTSLSNSAGALAQTYTFDSFGNQTAPSGSLTNPFQYTARESDTETGLYFYRARYYDPNGGRFVSEDPMAFRAGVDFYAYVLNNPTNLVDPKGLLQVCCRSAHQPFFQAWARLTLQPTPCHCFLKLSDGHTLGGYFSWSIDNSLANVVLRPDDKSDHNTYAKEAKCKDVPGCDSDARAKRAFDSLPKTLGAYGFGPEDFGTSNDAAALILNDAGIGFSLPARAWGKNAGYTPWGPSVFFGGTFPVPVI